MRVLREPQIISGFLYEHPVDALPCLTHCGEALLQKYRLPPHRHEGFEFLYLSRGNTSWQFPGRREAQEMGDLIICHPREIHETWCDEPESYHLWIGLRLDALGRDGRRLASLLTRNGCRLLTGCHEMKLPLQGLIRQVVGNWPRRQQVVLAYIRAFLSLIEQRVEMGEAEANSSEMALPYSHSVQKALSFMEQNLDRRLPLGDIAAVATARNVPHFCSQFHHEVGQTPSAFHVQLRLNAASVMLRQPGSTVTLAAYEYGFSSSQHFSAQFRKLFNLTPRDWIARAARQT